MNAIEKQVLDTFKSLLLKWPSAYKTILFGSYAYGRPTVDSETDLMIVMDTDVRPHKRAVPIRKILKGIGIPKDIIVRTPEKFERFKDIIGTIIYPAAHKRKVLYER